MEAAIGFIGGRWWRTAKATSMAQAQQSLEAWTIRVSDARARGASTVGALGAAEPLRALPALAFPAQIIVQRVCSRSALIAFDGNHYSVAPAHAGQRLEVRARVGEPLLQIFTTAGTQTATHRRALSGAGQTIRSSEHAAALNDAVLDAFTTQTVCASKVNRPPGEQALAALAALHGHDPEPASVIDLDRYAVLARTC